jgi:hypothetical protein
MSTTINLVIEVRDNKPIYEEVHVENCGAGTYRLLQSPGLVLGLAANDVFLLEPGGAFKVLQRGGNIAIQIFSAQSLERIEPFVSSELEGLGGRLDGQTAKELIYTVPAQVGFPDIERTLNDVAARFPSIKWYYGNVYDPVDGVTPLNWWLVP